MIRLMLFGCATLHGESGPLSGRAVQRRRLALLALLAIARGRGVSRERLIGYLWPDADPERARHQLSDSIYRINQATGGEAVIASGEQLRLNPERLACDVQDFAEAFERQEWKRCTELYGAPFMDGFFLTDCDELEQWVEAQRERLSREHARAVEQLAEAAELTGNDAEALHWWQFLSRIDPYSSRIALRVMRVLSRSGDHAAALEHARVHTELLADNIGVAPDADLTSYAAELRGVAAADAVPRPKHPCSVAVLPFHYIGPESDNGYFADGITEDIIAHLARIHGLRVIAGASAMKFRTREQSLRAIGAALGARFLLDGSIRRSGERVRIIAQLTDTDTDQHLWGATYDRTLKDVFAIQTEVALQIAAALRATLTPDERNRIGRRPTSSLPAYQHYLKGRHCLVRYTDEGGRQAAEYFARALELDPEYAPAYAGMAFAHQVLGENGALEPAVAYDRARDALARALTLDPSLAEAHCLLGHLKAMREFDWTAAEREFRCALELSPSSADAWDLYGRMCQALGRYDEALYMQRRAEELDPLANRSDAATTLIRAGRYDEALELARRTVAFDPHYQRARATLGWACIMKGLHGEGIAQLEQAVALSPENTGWLAQLGQAYGLTGRTEEALQVLQRLEALERERYVSPYHMAYVHTGLANHERALDYLDRAYENRAGAVYGIGASFLFTPLRAHPRFQALLRRINVE